MGREVGRTCELACDKVVIKVLDPQGRRIYGYTLLNAIGAYAKTQMTPVPIGITVKPDTPSNIESPKITTTPVSALEDLEANNVESITLTVDSCGIELVKSDSGKFTYDYLGITDTTKSKVNYSLEIDN